MIDPLKTKKGTKKGTGYFLETSLSSFIVFS